MKQDDIKAKLGKFKSVDIDHFGVRNQAVIYFENGRVFQSYSSPIVYVTGGKIYLTQDYDYSKTTGKYRNIFLGEDKKETDRNIKSGEYVLLED